MSVNRNALKRIMQQTVAARKDATANSCAVLWQRSSEPDAVFRVRAADARTRLHRTQLLVAVCAFDVVTPERGVCAIEIPPVALRLFDGPARYRVNYGGRGAGRSWTFARALIARCLMGPIRVLCAREFQNSIADSIHTLLADQVELLKLDRFFEIQGTTILGRIGSEIIFAGLKSNVSRIKSLEGVDVCYIEEGANIGADSWQVLIPTIRAPGSEIWCSFNPDKESDPTYQRFVVFPPKNASVLKTTYLDNPRFPATLLREAEYLERVDRDAFNHVWLGGTVTHSDAQIFRGKYFVESFMPTADWNGPYFGADWGFSQDPTTLVRCWVHERALYIEHEAYGIGVDIDKTPILFDRVPGSRTHVIRADSARPETISYMRQHGFDNMQSVSKWSGSVEDGITHVRSYERVVIHPRCAHVAEEFRLYSFKVDRLTGDVQPSPVDKHNHMIDALRYALTPMIQGGGPEGLLGYYKALMASDPTTNNPKLTGATTDLVPP